MRAGCNVANSLRAVDEITAETLQQKLDQVVLIDVRDQRERQVSVIPGAITQEQFEQQAEDLAEKTLVAYCTAGYRSGAFAAERTKHGQPCLSLKGGILAWCHQNRPLVKPDGQPTYEVHVHGRMWNLVDAPYRGVW